jgi:alkylation response protein AidB-like acyl-CoA dehydrogenase
VNVDASPDAQQVEQVNRRIDEFLAAATELGPSADRDQRIWNLQYDYGLAWVDFPVGIGGLGAAPSLRGPVAARLAQAGIRDAASINSVGIGLVAPVLNAFGTREQQERLLRPMFNGTEIWCQLFSEPNAGSDLASLATKAVRSQDSWVVNGQKVWTTLGHVARWGILCARTDPDKPKHKGLTCFAVDMTFPGIEVRPIRQLTGDAEFNEVFLDDVHLPLDAIIGTPDDGWSVILATLASERAFFSDDQVEQGGGTIDEATRLWERVGREHPELMDRYLTLWTRAEAVRLASLDAQALEKKSIPTSARSYLKLLHSELDQDILDFCVTLLGAEGLEYGSYAMHQPTTMEEMRHGGNDVRRKWLFARCETIAGGTSEVQRTIVADRVLRLPREPSADRSVPWRELRR